MTALSQDERRRKRERAEHTRRIRELNDVFRRTFSGGNVVMTAGVDALPDMVKAEALKRTATFDAFSEDNDPHGEHDFGSFEHDGSSVHETATVNVVPVFQEI